MVWDGARRDLRHVRVHATARVAPIDVRGLKYRVPGSASPVDVREIKQDLYSSFAGIASLIGYSEVHGRIIAALTATGEPLSLQELADETGYSTSSISTSLDLLEVLDMVSKIKKPGDRKLYVQLEGDLLEGLRKAILLRAQRGIDGALDEFEGYEGQLASLQNGEDKKKVENILVTLRGELRRLEEYLQVLEEIELDQPPIEGDGG